MVVFYLSRGPSVAPPDLLIFYQSWPRRHLRGATMPNRGLRLGLVFGAACCVVAFLPSSLMAQQATFSWQEDRARPVGQRILYTCKIPRFCGGQTNYGWTAYNYLNFIRDYQDQCKKDAQAVQQACDARPSLKSIGKFRLICHVVQIPGVPVAPPEGWDCPLGQGVDRSPGAQCSCDLQGRRSPGLVTMKR